MKHPDYDRAFHETPEYIRSAIELGFMKGKKAMKMRYKITSALSVAAALAVVLGAAAFGASRLGAPRPDGTLPGKPLSGPAATEYVTAVPDEYSTTPAPTAVIDPDATPAATAVTEPDATAAAIVEDVQRWELRTVYASGANEYFHRSAICNGQESQNDRELSIYDAFSEGLTACPDCLSYWSFAVVAVPPNAASAAEGTEYLYYSGFGSYFHSLSDCSGMEGAEEHTLYDAFTNGKTACPVCLADWDYAVIMRETPILASATPEPTIPPESMETEAPALETIYFTEYGNYFHAEADCSGMVGAAEGNVQDAYHAGKEPCPICLTYWNFEVQAVPVAAATAMPLWESRTVYAVYGTANFFHREAVCNAQDNRRELSVSDALREGLKPCTTCLPSAEYALVIVPNETIPIAEQGQQHIYYTKQGMYFHVEPECSGMENAEMHTVREALDSDRTACPVCTEGWGYAIIEQTAFEEVEVDLYTAAPVVYVTTENESTQIAVSIAQEESEWDVNEIFPGLDLKIDDTVYGGGFDFYFHLDPNCSHLQKDTPMTVYDAIMAGLGVCPFCSPDNYEEIMAAPTPETEAASGDEALFYYTSGGTYYHIDPNCSGMRNAEAHTLKSAVSWDKIHCPVCIGDNTEIYWQPVPENDGDTVYTNGHSHYYHVNPECFKTENYQTTSWTLADIKDSYTPCPACLSSLNPIADSPQCFTSEKDVHYHSDPDCSHLVGSQEMTEIEAQSQGKTRCPDCASLVVNPQCAKALESTLGPSVREAYPGYIFEREEALNTGNIVWYISSGESVMQAITFHYDEPNGPIKGLYISSDEWAMGETFGKAFMDKLPEPFQTALQNSIDPDTVFQINVEFDSDGVLSAISFGTFENETFNYPRWTVGTDGELEFAGDDLNL